METEYAIEDVGYPDVEGYLIPELEMPYECQCGEEFEFYHGNCCPGCGERFCEDCLDEFLALCPDCRETELD